MVTQKTKKYHENMTRVFHSASSNHLENVRKHEEAKSKLDEKDKEEEKIRGLDEE